MASSSWTSLLLLVLATGMLVGGQPAAAHPAHSRKLQQHRLAAGTAETDAAAAALLRTAQPVPSVLPAGLTAGLAAVAVAAASEPISKRSCGTVAGSSAQRRAVQRRFQQRLQQLKARGEDVSVAQAAPVIRVFFNVITLENSEGVVTQDRIEAQMATLNAAFSPAFSFQLVNATQYTTNNTDLFYNGYDTPDEVSTKRALYRGSAQHLNIYTWAPAGLLGYASVPWNYDKRGRTARSYDGVVLHHDAVNGGSFTDYNLGDTAVHEVGHWLGLYHTFDGGCGTTDTANSGDFVADTPAVRQPNGVCNPAADSCIDSQGPDLVKNYMDYTDDVCIDSFTPGQVARMQAMWALYRK